MRTTLLILSVAVAGGCGIENELQFRSTLVAETQGVALSDNGLDSYAAMVGTTCTIDTTWGCPTADADLPTDGERVTDHYRGRTLAVSSEGVHQLDAGLWDGQTQALANVHTAKLSDVGTLLVGGTGEACWFRAEGAEQVVPGALCTEGVDLEVDRRGGVVAATAEGVYAVDAMGVRSVDPAADLVAVDAVGGRMYLANRGGREVRAVDDTGVLLWTAEAGGAITDIEVRGDKEDLIVLGHAGGDLGQIERFDGATGLHRSTTSVPSPDGRLSISGNGHTLALVRPGEVHHFAFSIPGEPAVVRDESVECPDLPIRQSDGFTTD